MVSDMRPAVWPIVFGMLFGAGCAGQTDLVRPEQRNLSQSLGENIQCTPELLAAPNGAQRFIVEWNDGDREALETEMADGVALVKYTCDGIEVLRSCAIPGEYGYRAGSRKTKSLQITDAVSASMNLSSPTPGAALQAAMEQGKALNLAYVMIGSMTTPVKDVTRDQIERSACKEATHFVYQTQVGAFAVEAGEQGKATTAAEILRYGNAQGEMASERQSLSADGDAESCEESSSDDNSPPEGCRAMMRISIIPLVDGKIETVSTGRNDDSEKSSASKKQAAIDTRSCPEGMVFDADLCVKPSEATSYLCERGDGEECEKQCQNGSEASCGRLAEAFFDEAGFYGYYLIKAEKEPTVFDALKAAKSFMPLMLEACDEEEANACTLAGLIIGAQSGQTTEPDTENEAEEMLELFSEGCGLGNDIACSFVLSALGDESFEKLGIEGDGDELEDILSNGCDSGASDACMDLGGFYYEGNKNADDPQLQADLKRAAKYTAKACLSGVSESCFWGAALYATNEPTACMQLINKTAPEGHDGLEYYVGVYWPELNGESRVEELTKFCKQSASVYNPERAQVLGDKACYLSDGVLTENACQISKELKR